MNFTSSMSSSSAAACLPGAGLSTHRITKNPIISMTRSAKVKIHSGHSSHSVGLHLQAAFLAMGLRGLGDRCLLLGAEEAQELHFYYSGVVAGLDAQDALQDDFFGEDFLV